MYCDKRFPFERRKNPTNVQWIVNADDQKELYDDLGIIGEISPSLPSPTTKAFSMGASRKMGQPIKYGMMQTRDSSFGTPSSGSMCIDVKLKRALNRKQRKRSHSFAKPIHSLFGNKSIKMDSECGRNTPGLMEKCHTRKLPDEVLLKVFGFCNSETRVICSQVSWRWFHIANDESLWQQVSLAKQTTDVEQVQKLLRRGVKVICLNCAIITQKEQPEQSSSWYDDSGIFNSSPRLDPFSRAYHYSVHSLDLTNANVNPNVLCLILIRCNRLRNLSLEGLTISHNVLGCLSSCSELERVNLCLCHEMTMLGLVQMIGSCQKILELNIAWSNLCHSNPVQIINSLPACLSRINISGFRDTLRDYHIANLVQKCKALTEVDISDSSLITEQSVNHLIEGLHKTLRAVNLSRCYSVGLNSFLRFSRLPQLRFLDVFGVMDDHSIATLAAALPRVRVCLRPFSAISRPSPSALYGTKRRTIWGYHVV